MKKPYEVPPTAGLPLRWRDFLPASGKPSLEEGLAAFLGLPAVQVECSGTASLVLALEVLKRRSRRRKVILPAYTCPLVPLAVAQAGLETALCDLGPNGLDLDPHSLSVLCDSQTLCVIPTHLAGAVADLAPVLEIARRAGAFIIEDAAQALGAAWNGAPVGTFGDIGFYSLACGKGLTLYEGGVLIARDSEMREALRRESEARVSFQWGMELKRSAELLGYRLFYHPAALRWSYGARLRHWLGRNDPVRAVGDDLGPEIPIHRVGRWRKRIGAAALERLPGAIRGNVERGRRRARMLGGIPGLHLLDDRPGRSGAWPFLMIWFDSAEASTRALSRLWRTGLGVSRLFIHPLTGYSYLKGKVPAVSAPNAEAFAARALTVSNSPWLTDGDFESIRAVLEESARSERASIARKDRAASG